MKQIARQLTVLTFLLLLSANLIAADKPPPVQQALPPEPALAWERRLPELRSDALPLEHVVDLLRRQFPELNFIVKEKARALSVSVTLRSVTLDEILKAIDPATEGRVQVIWPTNNEVDRLIVFDRTLSTRVDPSTGLPLESKKICRVFNLGEYLSGFSDQELDTAIKEIRNVLETAWQMLRQANGEDETIPALSIHRGTRLLVAVGRPEDLAILEEVVIGLQGSAPGATIKRSGESGREPRSKAATGHAPSPATKE